MGLEGLCQEAAAKGSRYLEPLEGLCQEATAEGSRCLEAGVM
jgi:hypothetical protein